MYYLSLRHTQGLQEENGEDAGEAGETSAWAESLDQLWGETLQVAHEHSLTEGLGEAVTDAREGAPVEALDWQIGREGQGQEREREKHEDGVAEEAVRMGHSDQEVCIDVTGSWGHSCQ